MSTNLDNAWGDEEGLDISDDGFGWEDDDDLFGNSEDANNTSHIIDVPEIKGIEEDNDDNDNGEDDDSRLGFPSATPVTASIPPPVSSPSPTEEESQIGWEDDDNLFGNSEDDGYGEEVLETTTTTTAAAKFQRNQSKNSDSILRRRRRGKINITMLSTTTKIMMYPNISRTMDYRLLRFYRLRTGNMSRVATLYSYVLINMIVTK